MIINLGSMNIDYVYRVDRFVQPGETISSSTLKLHAGGKGLNQSIAAARAGASVRHAGITGHGGEFLRELLADNAVDTALVRQHDCPNGHAIIQVDKYGQNCILLYAGTNEMIDASFIRCLAAELLGSEIVLLQNETSGTAGMMEMAKARGCRITFNPAPMSPAVQTYPMTLIDYLVLNESEGETLTGETVPKSILKELASRFPATQSILTLGADGVSWLEDGVFCSVPARAAGKVIDTTAAGDTFIGYFLACIDAGKCLSESIEMAVLAAGICVTRNGAASSIPFMHEVQKELHHHL